MLNIIWLLASHPVFVAVGVIVLATAIFFMRILASPSGGMNLTKVKKLNVVITGGSRGIGYALAKQFCLNGHSVIICATNEQRLQKAVSTIQQQVKNNKLYLGKTSQEDDEPCIHGVVCDVSSEASMNQFVSYIQKTIGPDGLIHVWINNAGVSTVVNRPLHELDVEQIDRIVSVNMFGSIISTRAAIKLMLSQKKGGHVFNMEGAGSRGGATANMSVYGCTKAAVSQFTLSVQKELANDRIGIHRLSPGMVITDLLVKKGTPLRSKRLFNILAEEPSTVASYIYDRIRNIKGSGSRIAFLTPISILYRFATYHSRTNRFFDYETGEFIYKHKE